MAAKIPFPYHPANKFHAGVKARFEIEAETPQSIDRLTDKVVTSGDGTMTAIGDVASAIREFPDGKRSKQIFDRLIAAIETIATGLPDGDAIDKKLGEITKMGERTLRRLLIIGSAAVVLHAAKRGAAKGSWLEQMMARKPRMLVTVALANKTARIVWAVLRHGRAFEYQAHSMS